MFKDFLPDHLHPLEDTVIRYLNHKPPPEYNQFFTIRSVDVWNKLPQYIIKAPSVNSFKNPFNS